MNFYYVYTFEICAFPNFRFFQKVITNISSVEKVKSLCISKLFNAYKIMTNCDIDYSIKFCNCQKVYTIDTALDVVLI